MNKTMKRGFSLVMAMVFALSMLVVPTAFAATMNDLQSEGWNVALYKDVECSKPITALKPGQEAYVQFSLTNIRAVAAVDVTLTATGMTFEEIVRWDYQDANSPLEQATTKLLVGNNVAGGIPDSTVDPTQHPTTANSFAVSLGRSTGVAFDADAAYFLKGMNETKTEGTELKILTVKVKAAETNSAPASVAVTIRGGIKIGYGGKNKPANSDLTKYGHTNNLENVGLPTLDAEVPPVLVKGDAELETDTLDVPKNKDPFGNGGYSFRVTYTNGDTVDLPLSLKAAAQVTDAEKGAFVDAAVADFVPTQAGQPMVKDITVVDNTAGVAKTTITGGIKFNVSDTLYTLDPKPEISIPVGTDTITIDDVKASLKKDEGNGYVAMTDTEIAALGAITLVGYDKNTAKAGDVDDYTVNIVGLPLVSAAVQVTTTPAIPNGKYELKDVEYTVYTATLSKDAIFNTPLSLMTIYTDGTKKDEGKTTAKYTISAEAWADFCDKAAAAAGVYEVAITLTDDAVNPATSIKLNAKDAAPLDPPEYRVKEAASIEIDYMDTVDAAAVEFEQNMDTGKEAPEWLPSDLPADWTVTVDGYSNNIPGEYTAKVTVKDADGKAVELKANTVKVIVNEALLDEFAVTTKDGKAFALNYKTAPTLAVADFKVQQYAVKNGSANKVLVDVANPTGAIAFVVNGVALTADNAKDLILEDLTKVDVTYDGKPAGSISVAVSKEADSYSANWIGEAAPVLAKGTAASDIVDLIRITAHYGSIEEPVTLTGVTLEDYDPAVTTEQAVKVMYDGKAIATLNITLAEGVSNAKTNIPVAGVELVGPLTTTATLDKQPTAGTITLTVAANSESNVKLLATVNGATPDTYTTIVKFPGFTPVEVTINVTEEGATATLKDGAKLIAGYVAGDAANKTAIDDNDFYAIANSLGEEPSGAKAKYDLNRDGEITMLDIAAVLSNIGTQVK